MAVQAFRSGSSRNARALRRPFKAETAALVLLTVGVFAWRAGSSGRLLSGSPYRLLAWAFALALLSLLEIPTWRGQALVPDVPILIALAIVFDPFTAAAIAFLASCNVREFTGGSEFLRGLNNHANTAIGVFVASEAASPLLGNHSPWRVVAGASIALVVWTIENYAIVGLGVSLMLRVNFRTAVARLSPGKPSDYALVIIAWWLLASLLAISYDSWGLWSVAAFLLLALPLRQVLARGESAATAERLADEQRRVVEALSARILGERRDERLRVAADLHDELIPALFDLSLLSRVIEHDVTVGSPDVLGDVRDLRIAAEHALSSGRNVIEGLRSDPLGPRGLSAALGALAADLEAHSNCTVKAVINGVGRLPAEQEPVVYQVAKEALANAVRHSKASTVRIELSVQDEGILLHVTDDGVGFNVNEAKRGHFGLLIMQERAAAVGAAVYIDSVLGHGTNVTALFPTAMGE